MKRILVIAGFLLVVAVSVLVVRTMQRNAELNRVSSCLDEMQYDFVDIGDWQAGGLDVITTPVELVGVLGKPDTVEKGDGNRLADFYRYPQIGTSYNIWHDSVAILSQLSFDSGAPALVSGDGLLDGSTSLKDVKEFYPNSYACRNVPFDPSGWSGGAYDTSVEIVDTLHWNIAPHGVRIELLFKEGKLKVVVM